MKNYLLTFTFLLSMNLLYGQESDGSKEINLFAKDSIFEMPMYIPILESEEDSIHYGYKTLRTDFYDLRQNDDTINTIKPFVIGKIEKPSFLGGDQEIVNYVNARVKLLFKKNKKNKQYSMGYTTVRFKVIEVGYIRDVEIIKSCSPEYDNDIKKIIELLPAFAPNSRAPLFYCILSITYPIKEK